MILITLFHFFPLAIIGLVTGILFQSFQLFTIPTPVFALISLFIFLLCLAIPKKSVFICSTLFVTFFIGIYTTRFEQLQREKCEQLLTSYTLAIRGKINEFDFVDHNYIFTIQVEQYHTSLNQTWRPLNALILVYNKDNIHINIGDYIEIPQLCCAPSTPEAHIIFKHKKYAGIAFNPAHIHVVQHAQFDTYSLCSTTRKNIVDHIQKKLPAETYTLFSLLFLGKKEPSKNSDFYRIFSSWGLNHYLARAGLHVLIFFILLNFLLSLMVSRFIIKTIANTAIALGYAVLTWTNIPFTRALFVFLVYQCGHVLKIPLNSLHVLNLVCFGYLLINPLDIFSIDTQLTFAITYSLIIISTQTQFSAS